MGPDLCVILQLKMSHSKFVISVNVRRLQIMFYCHCIKPWKCMLPYSHSLTVPETSRAACAVLLCDDDANVIAGFVHAVEQPRTPSVCVCVET